LSKEFPPSRQRRGCQMRETTPNHKKRDKGVAGDFSQGGGWGTLSSPKVAGRGRVGERDELDH